jgi:cbb3-type cytochrome oxidase subunit 1
VLYLGGMVIMLWNTLMTIQSGKAAVVAPKLAAA